MLEGFSPAVRSWFAASFPAPTPPQGGGWRGISSGGPARVGAPTGSGKTLTAFLSSIDRLVTPPGEGQPVVDPAARTRVLYLSPLRALAFDVEKNLRAPLVGIGLAAEREGVPFVAPTVAMRTGDTPGRERQALIRRPPDLLITTPESLYLMLTSEAHRTLVNVETVIIDEIHAMAGTKRGAHLMLSLERLEEITARPPQRIGLSATQRPLEEIAHFLGGHERDGSRRRVTIVDAGIRKPMELEVVVPVDDMSTLGQLLPPTLRSGPATSALDPQRSSIWPSIYPRILAQVLQHRSTIIFCNARRQAERLAARLNQLAEDEGLVGDDGLPRDLVKAHHGSLAREQRIAIEDELKRGELRAIVATSSLELGIDMGAVDLVVQVESPGAVSRGLQRIGRAGHSVGEPSRGTVYPKHRGDLLEAAVVARRMRDGLVETTRFLRNPLDVLAQQIVAHVSAHPDCTVDDLASMVRRTACFHELSDDLLRNVLDLLAGRYPSDEFNELRPRLVWDRVAGTLRARDGAKRLAVVSGGTIPDRGLFGVFLPDGTRVGELDEEMVYESRPGETFLLGASTWRIEDITFDRVVVTPAPGQPGKMPFWHGDRPGRPLELGRALGEFVRTTRAMAIEQPDGVMRQLMDDCSLDALAASNVVRYLDDQVQATGALPDDRTVVVERFRDEIGDWRVCILSTFGTRVHAPWAIAVQRRLGERFDTSVEVMWTDDGIVVRLPEAIDDLPIDDLMVDPAEIDELLVQCLPQTSLFAARFRECAARALLLPRRRPDQRTPLWQQRQRAHDLLSVAAKYPTFPMLLEAGRECMNDVFDLPGLREVLTQIRDRTVRVVSVDTPRASPFSQSLLFNWIAAYMYEGDAPLAERRAAALALDRELLRDLLGAEELRDVLDPGALADVELELQLLSDGRRARDADELHDVLRRLGDLSRDEIALRVEVDGADVDGWLATLERDRRAYTVAVAGETRWIAADDAARYRDALGCAVPLGLPREFTEPTPHPLESLVARYARTHGPFTASDAARRFGTTLERVVGALQALEAGDRVARGEFRPGGSGGEWVDTDVLRQLRRRSLAALRREIEPVEPAVFARFVAEWGNVGSDRRGLDHLVETVGQLQGAALVASSLERDVLPARVRGLRPVDLDSLCTSGDLVWVGAGALGASDGRVRLFFADQLPVLLDAWERPEPPAGPLHDALRRHLAERGASFWLPLRGAVPDASDAEVLTALWDLVWAGEVTNDSLAPLRSYLAGGVRAPKASAQRQRPRPGRLTRIGPPAAAGRWSLVAHLLPATATAATATAHALALVLLDRHGVVTRESVAAEGVRGGYSSVYGVLKVLEERGQCRRGYFVAGLGAAQFALPGAVDRVRSGASTGRRDHDEVGPVVVLAATDPAQPYGASLEWPASAGRPTRSANALVLLCDGTPLVWFDHSSHHLVTFDGAAADGRWAEALAALVKDGRLRAVEVRKVDGASVAPNGGWAAHLRAAGFEEGYRGWVRRS
ncbi:MAG: Lhr family helicase [Ilumatobacteraceae bacterium]